MPSFSTHKLSRLDFRTCFSDVGLPSLFVTALSNISCFCQVECTFSNISTC